MKNYITEKPNYYKNIHTNMIYKTDSIELFTDEENGHYLEINLELVAGYSIIEGTPNEFGWIKADNFPEDKQTDSTIQWLFEESADQAFKAIGYEKIEKLPKIH
jgi:hypothetical protein